jgi:murein DD-endopeptidase MepM/ murein hydrolase activator NlpD
MNTFTYVDKQTMSNIVVEQRVGRRVRAKPKLPARQIRQNITRNPAGKVSHHPKPVRTEFIQQVKQRPVRVSRPRPAKKAAPSTRKEKPQNRKPPFFSRRLPGMLFGPRGLFPLPENSKAVLLFTQAKTQAQGEKAPKIPLSPLIAVGLTLVVSLVAINWKSPVLSLGTQDNAGLSAGQYSGDLERNLASYAGLQAGFAIEESDEIPLNLMETFSWNAYKVVKGDTLSGIAQTLGLSLGTLISSNNITNARRLQEGETLRVPNMDGVPYTVKAGDSLSGISSSTGVPLQVILDVNDLQSDVIQAGTSLFLPGARMAQEEIRLALGESFVYPVRGVMSSNYGWRIDPIANVGRFHSGIDLAAPLGTPVMATMDGKVSHVAVNSVYGNYIILTHSGGYQSLYAHLSAVTVKQGASVIQGTKIGEVGSTGYSTGPHLHFAVFKNDKVINPLEVLKR